MTFHAQIASPLGPILLCSEGAGLSGLYYAGQSDCPAVAGLSIHRPHAGGPSSGTMEGLAIKNFKAHQDQNRSGDLFGSATEHVSRFWSAQALQAVAGELTLMQADTPAAVITVFRQTQSQLSEYYAGRRTTFDVSLDFSGTPFQKKIWQALLTIPYGRVVAYGDVARTAGLSARHGRPVGTAVGRNPITIIIPCHRVLSGTGTLNGYTGGLERKFALLELEGFTLR
jgi:methylated-DNA-[protein]-cysteine S-methyltransferase